MEGFEGGGEAAEGEEDGFICAGTVTEGRRAGWGGAREAKKGGEVGVGCFGEEECVGEALGVGAKEA